ncbi:MULTISPECIES: Bax inhibitor-1/YccA family protein [Rhodobacterales]|uniref:Bax inhibitor-1/YccA family protein n=1 Tax=Halocynthiibacter styelae TaxID=2761955 RepID=A0A8J7IF56_9RHOB|nr:MULTISPECIES: Bax inhibitor-1/YccA family protein [Rhodobacterales]MBI1494577.1 Bax inhibitor-1/YccA family protein [Paenihalocynthiibacter styelae]
MATYHQSDVRVGARAAEIDAGLRAHMNKVYGTMSIGMLITALAAWAIAGLAVTSDPTGATVALREGQYLTGLGEAIYMSPLRWVIAFGPLAFLFFGWGAIMRRASSAGVQLGFFIFASVIGLSLSSIFLVYTDASIVQTFLVTSIAFASLSIWGYVTKRDLSAMGGFLMMGVIGLIIAMVLNMFLQSSVLTLAVSAIGVVLFAGLTAFYTQDIKNTYVAHAMHGDQEWLNKAAIDGAMSLYLAFLNMFQFLLMFLGQQE